MSKNEPLVSSNFSSVLLFPTVLLSLPFLQNILFSAMLPSTIMIMFPLPPKKAIELILFFIPTHLQLISSAGFLARTLFELPFGTATEAKNVLSVTITVLLKSPAS